MESRIKGRVLSIVIAGAMIASMSTTWAATTKPTPKPTAKATKKVVTKKPVVKKPTVKKTTAKKSTPRKTYVYKRKVVKVAPSPSPAWPPKPGFNQGKDTSAEIYWKVPPTKELAGLLSADHALASQMAKCVPGKFACGVIRVASVNGCKWWEINSTVRGPLSATDNSNVLYGNLRTTASETNPKQIVTILLISSEPLKPNVTVNITGIACHHDQPAERIPSNAYVISTPTPTETPTANTN